MMELEDVRRIIEELRGRFDQPFSSEDKETIEKLYFEVLGRQFRPTSCQQCYHDAFIEISLYIKKNGKMKTKCQFILLAGAIIHSPLFMNGQIFTNSNLTDEVAAAYLKMFPKQVEMFQKLPEGYKVGDDVKGMPTLEEAEAMLKKAETLQKGAATKVENIMKNIASAETPEKKEKAEKALANAQAALEKADKNVAECAELVKSLIPEDE